MVGKLCKQSTCHSWSHCVHRQKHEEMSCCGAQLLLFYSGQDPHWMDAHIHGDSFSGNTAQRGLLGDPKFREVDMSLHITPVKAALRARLVA